MNEVESHIQCPAECPRCPANESETAAGQGRGAIVSGWPLVLAAATYFLLPLVLAFVGAVAGGARQVNQLLGGAAGLGAGMVLAAQLTRFRHPRDQEEV